MIRKILKKVGHLTLNIKKETKNETIIKPEVENEILKNKSTPKSPKILLILLISLIVLLFNFQIGVELLVLILLIILIKYKLPNFKSSKKKSEITQMLPFALRELATELKAGVGLFDSMQTIATSNYGSLSEEFSITLNEIQYGTNYMKAFNDMAVRINLPIFDNITNQITRTLRNGGNLADILNSIASENSSNMKLKYKEYSQKLNSVMLLYMFLAVLIPVILFIMIIAATTVIGPIIDSALLIFLYLFFFPMIVVFMIIFIKNMEPSL